MSAHDRSRYATELRLHRMEITRICDALAHDAGDHRLDAYLNAQVIRHQISVALLEARLSMAPRNNTSRLRGD